MYASQVSSAVVELTSFKVLYNSPGVSRRRVFANGNMQVQVQVVLAGVDANGNSVRLPGSVLNTVQLINYQGGTPLGAKWRVSSIENKYLHEHPGDTRAFFSGMSASDNERLSIASEEDLQEIDKIELTPDQPQRHDEDERASDGSRLRQLAAPMNARALQEQVVTLWVAASEVGTVAIAARISLPNNKVITTNGIAGDFDSYVELSAVVPLTYAPDQYRLTNRWIVENQDNSRIYNYYLGLYPGGTQLRLVSWTLEGSTRHNVRFFRSGKVAAWRTMYLEGVMLSPSVKQWPVNLPSSGSVKGVYSVPVNDRDGELTMVQIIYRKFYYNFPVTGDQFRFVALDEYGTEHRLSIRSNVQQREFFLERG